MTITLLHEIIETWAAKTPEAEAFVHLGDRLTYADMRRRAAQLATALRGLGVRKGDRVGIYRPIGVGSVVGSFGTLWAGAAYVPIDPNAPAQRVSAILRECGIDVLISAPSRAGVVQEVLSEASLRAVIGLDDIDGAEAVPWDDVLALPEAPLPKLVPEDISYVIMSSGSTGVPKGIVHSHASGLSFASYVAQFYDIRQGDRAANHAGMHFDTSTFALLGAPYAGARAVLIPEPFKMLPAEMSALVDRERITHWISVPFALTQLLEHGALDQRDLASLRWVLAAGDTFAPQLISDLMARLPDATFANVYGPAEVNECANHVFPGPPAEDAPVPIGKVCDHCEGLVVDDQDRPVPPGEAGELLIRTGARMRGYWNRADMTANATYERPVCDGVSDLFHRTGDLVREGSDGLLYYLGRKDRQVKIRGQRIELEEIEQALLAHPSVSEAGAFLTEDKNHISAAVRTTGPIGEAALQSHCTQRLPLYSVPKRIQTVESLPRTATGKVDRRALRDLFS